MELFTTQTEEQFPHLDRNLSGRGGSMQGQIRPNVQARPKPTRMAHPKTKQSTGSWTKNKGRHQEGAARIRREGNRANQNKPTPKQKPPKRQPGTPRNNKISKDRGACGNA